MSTTFLFVSIIALALFGFVVGRARSVALVAGDIRRLHSLPSYYGSYVALWILIPSLALAVVWMAVQPIVIEQVVVAGLSPEAQALPPSRLGLLLNDIRNLAAGDIVSREVDPTLQAAADRLNAMRWNGNTILFILGLGIAAAGFGVARHRIAPALRARNLVENTVKAFLVISSTIAILTTAGIVLSLIFESIRFFHLISIPQFLFGLEWSPQTALRADQVGSTGLFGAIPLVAGTMLITAIAMLVAVPVGLFSAIYLSEYADHRVRAVVKPLLEILAGIPTVVYGFFAAITVAPAIRRFGESIGLDVASESALAAGVVMGIMIIPFVSSLSDDVMNAVPQAMRDGSHALGATRSETIKKVILPAALPGIFAAVLLAVSRAIGETMIVVMAAGLAANLTINPLEAVTTITVQIVTLLIGDQEFDSAKTLAAFALGLLLFCATLVMNIVALHVVRKYREQYE